MKTVPARLLILLACVLAPVGHEPSDAEEPDSAWARTATVDQIVDKIRLDEEWIWDSDSFYLEASGEWKITPEGIRFRLAELKTQFPDTDFDDPRAASQNMGLLPLVRENLLLAWDKNRIAKKDHKIEFSLDHRFFDGERVLIHEHFYHKDQEHYAIVQDRQRYISETAFANYSIGRLTWPNTWWSSSERGTAGANRYLSHVEDKGIQIRDGKAYRVLSSGRQATSRRELWIDAENGRLSYIRHLRMPNPMKAAMKWFTSTQDSEHPNPFELTPSSEFLLDDWRQVSPGKWFPFKQGHTAWLREKEDAGRVKFRRTIQVVKLQVNERLPEDLIQMNMKEGVVVHDSTHDPPLHYKHKKEFTKKQWDAILAEAMEHDRRRKSEKDRQQAMIGKPAPRLHTEKWIQGEPVDDAEGKLVILDFFADWCGPCRNDYPTLVKAHATLDKKDTIIVGIHPPGSKLANIKRLLETFEIDYPVAIDEPSEKPGIGKTYSEYKIETLPHAILIDRQGRIAARGSLSEVLVKHNQLMNKRDSVQTEARR